MLRQLGRDDVSEFAIASGRLPCVKVGGAYQPVDDVAPTSDQIMQMLVAAGGSRYIDSLGPTPTQWTTRVEAVGVIAVAAVMRDDKVQARFVVSRRDGTSSAEERGAQPGDRAPPSSSPRGTSVSPGLPPPRAPSIAGVQAPSPRVAPARAPSTSAALPPSIGTARAPSVHGVAGVPAGARPAIRRVAHEDPAHFPTPMSRSTPLATDFGVDIAPSAVVTGATAPMPGAMRMLDLEDSEIPTRPGSAAANIEIDLERAMTAATVGLGSTAPAGTARDFEFDPDGMRPATPSPSTVAPSTAAPSTTRAGAGGGVLDEMLAAARSAGASDLHVVAERPMLLRIAGELVPRGEPLDAATVEAAVLARIPPRCRDTLETDGSCDFALQHARYGRFRVNVTRQRTGLKMCARLIPSGIPTLASLGLPEDIAKATHHHQGLIVVTGPTGHGKTSTLAAIVDIINRDTTHHVITVEDPVEFIHPRKRAMMSQREVGAHTLSFQNALKASLREDPDVIVVGELRDTETVRMALAASETGHLVLGTMNTPSAAKTIDRLIDLFPPGDQSQVRMTLAGGLRLIVSQRLLPTPDGKAMVAATELLPGSIPLWSLIRDNKTFQIPSLQQRGKGAGILRLDDALLDLVRAGKTTREAAMAVAENADELDAQLSGKIKGAPAPEPPKKSDDPRGGLFQKAGSLFGKKGP